MHENQSLIRSDGQVYPLSYYGAKVTGLGSLPVEYQTTQGYKQQGVTVRDYRMQARSISIALTLNALTRRLLWDLRTQVIGSVNPEQGVVTYRKVLPDGQVREIRGWLDESLSIEDADDLRSAEVGFSLMCPDPSFYDPAMRTVTAVTDAAAELVLPFVIPDDFWFGGSNQYLADIEYAGTWRGYPQLIVQGPYDTAYLSNATTGSRIYLGTPVAEGSLIRIDTTPGSVKVTRDGEVSMGEVSDGNLVDFYLAPGFNRLALNGTGFSAASHFQVQYRTRYIAL